MPPPPVDPTPSGLCMVGGLTMLLLSAALPDSGPRMVGGLAMPPLSAALPDSGPRMVGGLTMPPLSAALTTSTASQLPSPPVSQSPEAKATSPAAEEAPKRRGRKRKAETELPVVRPSPFSAEDLRRRRGRKVLRTYWDTGATFEERQHAANVYAKVKKYSWMTTVSSSSQSPLIFLYRSRDGVQGHGSLLTWLNANDKCIDCEA